MYFFLTLVRFLAIPVLAYLIYARRPQFCGVSFVLGIWLTDMLDGFVPTI